MPHVEIVLHPTQRERIYCASLDGETIVSDSPRPMHDAIEELRRRHHHPDENVAFRWNDERKPFTTRALEKASKGTGR